MNDLSMEEYYKKRLPEYESIYAKPERQQDLKIIREYLANGLARHRVLEIACGTGYWTQLIATVADCVHATDVSPEALDAARSKSYRNQKVSFQCIDAFHLRITKGYTAVFGGFFWSHVPRQSLPAFLENLNASVGSDVYMLFIDNRFIPGSSTAILRQDAAGNSYQMRTLSDGSRFEVLKNFPDKGELQAIVEPFGTKITIEELDYFWILSYVTRPVG